MPTSLEMEESIASEIMIVTRRKLDLIFSQRSEFILRQNAKELKTAVT